MRKLAHHSLVGAQSRALTQKPEQTKMNVETLRNTEPLVVRLMRESLRQIAARMDAGTATNEDFERAGSLRVMINNENAKARAKAAQ
jgi:hypothetical protein